MDLGTFLGLHDEATSRDLTNMTCDINTEACFPIRQSLSFLAGYTQNRPDESLVCNLAHKNGAVGHRDLHGNIDKCKEPLGDSLGVDQSVIKWFQKLDQSHPATGLIGRVVTTPILPSFDVM